MALITRTVITTGGGDYNSLSAAEAAEQTDLVAAGDNILFECSGGLDANKCVFDGWTTGAGNGIKVNVALAGRHTMKKSTGYRIVIVDVGGAIELKEPFIEIFGVSLNNSGGDSCIVVSSDNCIIDSCFLYQSGKAISMNTAMATGCMVANTSICGAGTGIYLTNQSKGYIYNCSILNGSVCGTDPFFGTIHCKNVYSGNNVIDYQTGTFVIGESYTTSYSSDGTLANPVISVVDCAFTNSTAGKEDFHLLAASDLIKIGTDLHLDAVYPFAYDAEETVRTNGANQWDIGPDQTEGASVDISGTIASISNASSTLTKIVTIAPNASAAVSNATGILDAIEGLLFGTIATVSFCYGVLSSSFDIGKGRLFSITGTVNDEDNSEYIILQGLQIEEQGTGANQ